MRQALDPKQALRNLLYQLVEQAAHINVMSSSRSRGVKSDERVAAIGELVKRLKPEQRKLLESLKPEDMAAVRWPADFPLELLYPPRQPNWEA